MVWTYGDQLGLRRPATPPRRLSAPPSKPSRPGFHSRTPSVYLCRKGRSVPYGHSRDRNSNAPIRRTQGSAEGQELTPCPSLEDRLRLGPAGRRGGPWLGQGLLPSPPGQAVAQRPSGAAVAASGSTVAIAATAQPRRVSRRLRDHFEQEASVGQCSRSPGALGWALGVGAERRQDSHPERGKEPCLESCPFAALRVTPGWSSCGRISPTPPLIAPDELER